jgi:uncharacterized membrane protein SirB2
MFSYELYKIIHLTSLMIVFTSMSIQLVGEKEIKLLKILSGVGSFFILVSGMGLLARIGVSHGGMPVWAMLKIAIWITLAVGLPVVGKRFKQHGYTAYWVAMCLFVVAAIIVNYRI